MGKTKRITLNSKFKVFILGFFMYSLFSCSNHKDVKEVRKPEVYYIIKHPKRIEPINDSLPIIYPVMFYGNHNFILTKDNRIFYHNKFEFYSHEMESDISKPPRVNLLPIEIKEIKYDSLISFLNSNVNLHTKEDWLTSVSISFPVDSISNPAINFILDHFKSKNIRRYQIRNWTEEEQYALNAKINKMPYNPDTVKWKVGFDSDSLKY